MLKVDVVCPLYSPGDVLDQLLAGLLKQKNVKVNAIFPITVEDIDKDQQVIDKITNYNYSFFLINKDDFSHSLTRERAIRDYCKNDIVVMLSQDVAFINEDALFNLASVVNDRVVYAFGRQICHGKGIEDYTRQIHYPLQSTIVAKNDLPRLGFMAFFSSDAFAAYYRPVFLHLGGYDGKPMMMNEDVYYVRKVLLAGLCKAYVATAVVEHGHNYTLYQLFRRYKDTGRWLKENPQFAAYNVHGAGIKMALFILQEAWKEKNWSVLASLLPNMLARCLGFQLGKII